TARSSIARGVRLPLTSPKMGASSTSAQSPERDPRGATISTGRRSTDPTIVAEPWPCLLQWRWTSSNSVYAPLPSMLKKLAFAAACLLVVGAGLYVLRFRVALD